MTSVQANERATESHVFSSHFATPTPARDVETGDYDGTACFVAGPDGAVALDTLEGTAQLAIVVGIRLDPLDLLSVFREDGDGHGIAVYLEMVESAMGPGSPLCKILACGSALRLTHAW